MRYEFDNQQVCSSKDIDNYGIKCDCCGGKFQSVTYVDNKAYCAECYAKQFQQYCSCPNYNNHNWFRNFLKSLNCKDEDIELIIKAMNNKIKELKGE